MNEYKAALSDIMCNVPYGKLKEQENLLKELVEQATPKIPKKTEAMGEHYYACPRCTKAIDWSEDTKILQENFRMLDWSEEE